jgi:hypothetical protein
MTTQPPEPLDPDSPRGIQAANDLSDVFADVITRLRSEGKPVPDLSDGGEGGEAAPS